jgi:hypothetical protein
VAAIAAFEGTEGTGAVPPVAAPIAAEVSGYAAGGGAGALTATSLFLLPKHPAERSAITKAAPAPIDWSLMNMRENTTGWPYRKAEFLNFLNYILKF